MKKCDEETEKQNYRKKMEGEKNKKKYMEIKRCILFDATEKKREMGKNGERAEQKCHVHRREKLIESKKKKKNDNEKNVDGRMKSTNK